MSEIDTARLADWMDNAGLAGKGEPLEARFLSGGTQNVIYEIRRGEHTCVLRMPPAGLHRIGTRASCGSGASSRRSTAPTSRIPPLSACAQIQRCWVGRST